MTAVETVAPPAPSPPAPRVARAPVDILIPTFNEQVNLPHALRSVVGWANRVLVLDSGSTDGTQRIARELGADVHEHAWEGYARQKNWGLANLPFESPWVLILDADESITPELRDEIIALTSRPPDEVPEAGFYINRYFVFMGKRIRHCGYFPSWNVRLFKRGMAHYEDRSVHEHMIVNGDVGRLRGLMSHEDRRGLELYIAKHNRYSTLEAEAVFRQQETGEAEVKASLFGTGVERRRYIKERVSPHLPATWLGRFLWMYFLKLGFLDGLTGLRFCLFISSYELFTALKLKDLQRQSREAAVAEQAQLPDTTASKVNPMTSLNTSPQPFVPSPASRSPWSRRDKVWRVLWMFAQATLFRWSFHNWYAWRRLVLRIFGAQIGRAVRIRPTAHIEIPWNLEIGDDSTVGDHAIVYSLGKITLGRRVTISQYSHLCAGTHDYTIDSLPLLRPPIMIDDDVWVAADAFVGPGVTVGARSIVAARATVVKDVLPDQIVGGNPARFLKTRVFKKS